MVSGIERGAVRGASLQYCKDWKKCTHINRMERELGGNKETGTEWQGEERRGEEC